MSMDDAPRDKRRSRTERRLGEFEGDVEVFASYFKERVYATFTGLAIVLVVAPKAITPSRRTRFSRWSWVFWESRSPASFLT